MSHDTSIDGRRSETAFYREVLDASPVPMIILERKGNALLVIYVNRSFERRTGYSTAAILNNDWRILCGRDAGGTSLPEPTSDPGEETKIPFLGIRRDGSKFWSELTLAPLVGDDAALRYVGLLRDVTAELAEREQLTQFALQDDLTGLPNRRALDQLLTLAIERAQAEQRAFPVLLLDLDGFKRVNDTFGHDVGDQVLRVIGTRLRHELRANDTVSRIGGDEFVLVLESVRQASQLSDIRERICACVTAPVMTDGTALGVGCSMGASWFPLHGAQARGLLRHADQCMYEEKRRSHPQADGLFAVITRGSPAVQRSLS